MEWSSTFRKVLGGFYVVLILAAFAGLVVLFREERNSVNPAGIYFALYGLLFLLVPIATIAYGLLRSRPWVVKFHGFAVISWLMVTVPGLLAARDHLLRTRTLLGLALPILLVIGPIAVHWLLRRCRAQEFGKSEPAPAITKVLLVLSASIMVLPALILCCIAIFFTIFLPAPEREQLAVAENERFRVVAYRHPGMGVLSEEFTQVVFVDKASLLDGEHLLWSEEYLEIHQISLLDSVSAQVIWGREGDTAVFNLLDPPDTTGPVADDVAGSWLYRLSYDGCQVTWLAENDRYQVYFRRYPSAIPDDFRFARLLYRDKGNWFSKERILIECLPDDSIVVSFSTLDTVDVRFIGRRYVPGNPVTVRLDKSYVFDLDEGETPPIQMWRQDLLIDEP